MIILLCGYIYCSDFIYVKNYWSKIPQAKCRVRNITNTVSANHLIDNLKFLHVIRTGHCIGRDEVKSSN